MYDYLLNLHTVSSESLSGCVIFVQHHTPLSALQHFASFKSAQLFGHDQSLFHDKESNCHVLFALFHVIGLYHTKGAFSAVDKLSGQANLYGCGELCDLQIATGISCKDTDDDENAFKPVPV